MLYIEKLHRNFLVYNIFLKHRQKNLLVTILLFFFPFLQDTVDFENTTFCLCVVSWCLLILDACMTSTHVWTFFLDGSEQRASSFVSFTVICQKRFLLCIMNKAPREDVCNWIWWIQCCHFQRGQTLSRDTKPCLMLFIFDHIHVFCSRKDWEEGPNPPLVHECIAPLNTRLRFWQMTLSTSRDV